MAHILNGSSVIEDLPLTIVNLSVSPQCQFLNYGLPRKEKLVTVFDKTIKCPDRSILKGTPKEMLGNHSVEMKRNINWPSLSNPLKRRNTKASQDQDKDSTGSFGDQTPTSPSSKMSGSPQSPSGWFSSSSPTFITQSTSGRSPDVSTSPQTSSPTSPQSLTSRNAFRISSFIRGRQFQSSGSSVADPESGKIPAIMNPRSLPPLNASQEPEQEYNTTSHPGASKHSLLPPLTSDHHLSRMTSSPNITPLSSSSTWPGTDRSAAMLFSPVSPPTASDDTRDGLNGNDSMLFERPYNTEPSLPQINFVTTSTSYVSAPAGKSPLDQAYSSTTILDANSKGSQDIEAEVGFESPSDFALFAEATSSISFFPSDNFSTPKPPTIPHISSPIPPTTPAQYTITTGSRSNYESRTLPILHLTPSNSSFNNHDNNRLIAMSDWETYEPPRSRSVPPPILTNNHFRSTSNPAPLPPTRLESTSYSSQQGFVPRNRLIAEALVGLEMEEERNSSQNSDEELPDYATSQAEASERQRVEAMSRARQLEEGWLRGRADRIKRPWRAWERGSGI